MGDHNPGKKNEHFCLPSSLGRGMESLVYNSVSCIFAEAVKAVQGVTVRAQTQPTQEWHMELSPLRTAAGPCTQSQNAASHGQAQTED